MTIIGTASLRNRGANHCTLQRAHKSRPTEFYQDFGGKMALSKASQEGTARYKARFSTLSEHFRSEQDWWVSSIGLGTYLGEPDEKTDRSYAESVKVALQSGCNLFDTAINYRFQRSERSIGHAFSDS